MSACAGWKHLGRALYQPEGQDTLLLNLHKEMINRKSEDGFTALSLCAQGGHSEAVEYLLSQAAAILGRVATIRSPRRLPC